MARSTFLAILKGMGNELVLQTNIFFYITSVSVIVLTIFVAIILYYVLMIVRNIKDITDTVREGVHSVSDGVAKVREMVADGESKIMPIVSFVAEQAGRFGMGAKTKKRKGKVDKEE